MKNNIAIKKIEKDADSICIGIWVKVGSALENKQEQGLSHFIEHMLFKGTKKRTYRQIAEQMDTLGGVINAFTSREFTCFYVKVWEKYFLEAWNILTDIVTQSVIDKNELEQERKVILEEINMTQDMPDEYVFDVFMENAYKFSHLGCSILGTKEKILNYTRENLIRFMQEYYKKENIIITMGGKHRDIPLSALEGEWLYNSRENISSEDYQVAFTPGKDLIERKLEQSNIILGWPTCPIGNERKYAVSLFNNIFGGSMSSHLFQHIREEKGLAYSIGSSASFFKKTGLNYIFAGTSKKNTQTLVDEIKREIEKIKENYISSEELHKAKVCSKGKMILGLEDTKNLMLKAGTDLIYFGRYIEPEEVIKKIEDVKMDNIVEIIDDIDMNKMHLTILGDIKDIKW
jgi:predicted Zn-dependent peptidase